MQKNGNYVINTRCHRNPYTLNFTDNGVAAESTKGRGPRCSRAVRGRVSLAARFPTRPPCDGFLPTHCLLCGLSLLWGWVRSPEVLTRPRASAQGSQTFGIPPFAIVGRDDHLDWLSTSSPKPRHTQGEELSTSVEYDMPPAAGESQAESNRRRERHRKREEAAIRDLHRWCVGGRVCA